MNLKQYAAKIQKLAEKYPNAKVVYAKDEEGNGFKEAFYEPSAGSFKNGEWDVGDGIKVNAVCLN